ncbi:MAG: xanthine dehydrogenase family protein subunit M [Proteobacteria bacterium]|nr:xanthine dehydrogenase family protein subunit M [Pseudomonadota bacterium]
MEDFSYQKPKTVDDAREAYSASADGLFLAGGQTILPVMKLGLAAPSAVIDLGGIEGLRAILVTDSVVSIGAMATHATVAASGDVRQAIPALSDLAGMIGDPQVRTRGTIGGSIANNDPAADYPAAVLALNATITTDKRQIAADDFFVAMFETALEEGEIITNVEFPVADAAAYAKFANPASRFALAGVFVARTGNSVRVAVTGAGTCVFRVADMEAALAKDFSATALDGITVATENLNTDIHASAEYRGHLIGVMAKRAVEAAQTKGGGK